MFEKEKYAKLGSAFTKMTLFDNILVTCFHTCLFKIIKFLNIYDPFNFGTGSGLHTIKAKM